MDTLTFTSTRRTRSEQAVPVSLCGEDITVRRPKDAVLYFAQTIIGDTVSDADRAMAVLQFIEGTLDPLDRKRFFDRIIDRADPIDLQAVTSLVGGLLDRWNDWPADGKVEPLEIEGDEPTPVPGGPVQVVNKDLELEFTVHPPKDIVLLIVSTAMATGANLGQQAWAVGLFLDAALDAVTAMLVSRRMRSNQDDLDLEDIAEIVKELIGRWAPRTNRAQRRARARRA